jgi:hypothetical protein
MWQIKQKEFIILLLNITKIIIYHYIIKEDIYLF